MSFTQGQTLTAAGLDAAFAADQAAAVADVAPYAPPGVPGADRHAHLADRGSWHLNHATRDDGFCGCRNRRLLHTADGDCFWCLAA